MSYQPCPLFLPSSLVTATTGNDLGDAAADLGMAVAAVLGEVGQQLAHALDIDGVGAECTGPDTKLLLIFCNRRDKAGRHVEGRLARLVPTAPTPCRAFTCPYSCPKTPITTSSRPPTSATSSSVTTMRPPGSAKALGPISLARNSRLVGTTS